MAFFAHYECNEAISGLMHKVGGCCHFHFFVTDEKFEGYGRNVREAIFNVFMIFEDTSSIDIELTSK